MAEEEARVPHEEEESDEEPTAEGAVAADGKKKKKKKKKKPAGSKDGEGSSAVVPGTSTALSAVEEAAKKQAETLRALELYKMFFKQDQQPNKPQPAHSKEEALQRDYKFWVTQPVPQLGQDVPQLGPIEPSRPREEVQQDPYPLPAGYAWCPLDLDKSEKDLNDVYDLLNLNYVEDDENMFRFDYSKEFLLWALMPPGWKASWHVGVRTTTSNKLVAFISAVPASMRIHDNAQLLVEVNFLCVHKKLRAKRLAPVLIKEVTRRVHLEGIFQATYTAGVYLPTPVTSARYYHRSLNPKKLIEVGFSYLPRNTTMQQVIKRNKLPENTHTPGLRPMEKRDVEAAWTLVCDYLKKFKLAPSFEKNEFEHWMLPRQNVISSYVVEDPETHSITDFISFYTLNSTIIKHDTHKTLFAAYSYYNVANTCTLDLLMTDALILAKKGGHDVFNCLDLMDNSKVLESHKFGMGDGRLQYYLYNYACPEMQPSELGLVLL